MTLVPVLKSLSFVLSAGLLTHCASATPLRLDRSDTTPAQALVDVSLPDGSECIVRSSGGEIVRGWVVRVSPDPLQVDVSGADGTVSRRSFAHADVALLAKVVKMSKVKRGWVGAAIGAAASVPFGISMVGDMVVPAAILGSLIGRSTGDSHAEVVFERPGQ